MKKWSIVAFVLIFAMILVACGKDGGDVEQDYTEGNESVTENRMNPNEMFSDRDCETGYDESSSVQITLAGDKVSCSSDAVQIKGSIVTIKAEATYVFTGTLEDGMIVVDAEDTAKVQLVLDNASVTSKTSAPIYILEADKVFITLAEHSENTLANGGEFVAVDDNNIDGAVFSKQDLTFNGLGSLTVTSPAGHGIVCKDDLVFTGGNYEIQSASHGVDANDSVRVVNTTFSITSGKDGIRAENSEDASLGFVYLASGTYSVASEGDGISASAYMQIEDGTYHIVSGGGSENAAQQSSDNWGGFPGGGIGGPGGGHGGGGRMPGRSTHENATNDSDSSTSIKGLKAAQALEINGGTFTLDCADDAIHSNASVTVADGSFQIKTGDDGFHADDTLTVTAGTIDITESYEGLEGLHVDIQGGDIKLVSSDDGINAAGGTDESGYGGQRGNDMFGGIGGPGGGPGGGSASDGTIKISGGSIYMNASGDGIDANGSLEITGGETIVCGPTQGDTAVLDYDTSATISGGTFIGTGSYMMAQTFSDSEQGVIALSVGNQTAGTEITLKDKDGKTIIECAPELSYAIAILSSPDIVKGETYTVMVGQNSGEFEAN